MKCTDSFQRGHLEELGPVLPLQQICSVTAQAIYWPLIPCGIRNLHAWAEASHMLDVKWGFPPGEHLAKAGRRAASLWAKMIVCSS